MRLLLSGICEKTGPTCIPSLNFCINQFTAKRYQYCGSCRSFIDCTGSPATSAIVPCPEGTFFDDDVKNCVDTSTTCTECYTPCNETFPEEPTTVAPLPTTEELTTLAPPPTTEEAVTEGDQEAATGEDTGAVTAGDQEAVTVGDSEEETTSGSPGGGDGSNCSADLALSVNVFLWVLGARAGI